MVDGLLTLHLSNLLVEILMAGDASIRPNNTEEQTHDKPGIELQITYSAEPVD